LQLHPLLCLAEVGVIVLLSCKMQG